MLSATELHRRGLQRSNAGHHAAARPLFVRALERAQGEEMRARIELSLAYVEAELGTLEEGLERCLHALSRRGVPPEVEGLVCSQLGMVHMRAGDGQAALDAFARAESLLPFEHDVARGRLHLNRGGVYLQRKDPAAALRDFAAAAEHFERAAQPVEQAKTRHNMGYAQMLLGDLVGALESMSAARPGLACQGAVAAAVGDQDRAEALLAAGMPDQAAAALQEASEAFGRAGVRQGQAEALSVLARLRLRSDPAQARRDARRAMRLFSRRGSATWAARAEAVALAAEVAAGSRRGALRDDAARVGDVLRGQRLVHDAAMLQLTAARIEIAAGHAEAAERRLVAVPERDDEPLDNRLVRQEVRSSVAIALGRSTEALAEVRAGLDELADWQRSFGSLDLQSSFVGHGLRLARTGLRLALDDGRPEVVLEWIDRTRALATRVVPLRAPDDSVAAADLARLRRLRADIREGEESGADVGPLLAEHRDLQCRIRERAWNAPGSGQVRDTVNLAEVHHGLAPDDGLLLAHVTDGERLCVLVVDADHGELVDLGPLEPVTHRLEGMRADLDVAASDLPPPLRAVVRDGLGARLRSLGEALFGPLAPWLSDGRPVVLVPTGLLAGTPWTLLPDLYGHPVTVVQSVSLWASACAEPWRPPRSAVLVAGPRVSRAQEEIERSDVWSGAAVRLSGPDATVASVAAAAPDTDVLHLAAHGLHSADNPLFSGLELADGPWFGYDIDGLDRVPSTVLLSACELGRSTVRWGEETIGMTAAWLHAGARAVIASPAAVDDDIACEVLAATHERLVAGVRPAIALRDAVDAAGLQADSSFVCFGQGW